jgi:hypothetical protein
MLPHQSNGFTISAVSGSLGTPVGVVQVDQAPLVNNMTYPSTSALEVVNMSGQNIPADTFTVSLPGSSAQSFPQQTWSQGQVLAFFSTTSAGNFNFNLAGSSVSPNPNGYPNVTYTTSGFNVTLGTLINGSLFGGRFQLTSVARAPHRR